jgi:hypothetical protein
MMQQIELRTESSDLNESLEARVADPLWLLARQWQTGEFKGNDAGSPIQVHARLTISDLSRFRPGAQSTPGESIDYSAESSPLETLVERETAASRPLFDIRFAATTGLHFQRLLSTKGLDQYATTLRSAYGFDPLPAADALDLDEDSGRFLDVVGTRCFYGAKLYSAIATAQGNDWRDLEAQFILWGIATTDVPRLVEIFRIWRDWYESVVDVSPQGEGAWLPDRMEYAFSVAAPSARGELVLTVPEYTGGRLDWFAFDGDNDSQARLGTVGQPRETIVNALPTPVTFTGMPAARFWQFEDSRINFANIDADPGDLGRVMFLSFLLEYSNDWFMVPIELEVGALCHVDSLIVTNTFGEKMQIQHAVESSAGPGVWSMYSLSAARPAAATNFERQALENKFRDLFFLPPVLGPSLQGSVIEEVRFLRDEMANMAWAVERTITSPMGQPLNRHDAISRNPSRTSPNDAKNEILAYRLGTSVPANWIPLIPVQDGSETRLKRGTIPEATTGVVANNRTPQGRILMEKEDLALYNEEVPREGVRVTRAFQYTRWIGGTTHLWVGRRKVPGQGEGSSGLRFDVLEEPHPITVSDSAEDTDLLTKPPPHFIIAQTDLDMGARYGTMASSLAVGSNARRIYVGKDYSRDPARLNLGVAELGPEGGVENLKWYRDSSESLANVPDYHSTVKSIFLDEARGKLWLGISESNYQTDARVLTIYGLDSITGLPIGGPTTLACRTEAGRLYDVVSIARHPTLQRLYVGGYGDSAVYVFELDNSTGEPLVDRPPKRFAFGSGHGKYELAISSDGRYLYVGTYPDMLEIVELDLGTGDPILSQDIRSYPAIAWAPARLDAQLTAYFRFQIVNDAIYFRLALPTGFFLARWRLQGGLPERTNPEVFYDIALATLRGPSGVFWYPNQHYPAVVSAPEADHVWICGDLKYPAANDEHQNSTTIGTTLTSVRIDGEVPRIEYDIPIADRVGVRLTVANDGLPIAVVERTVSVR